MFIYFYSNNLIVKLNGKNLFQIFGQQKISAPEGLYLYGSVGKYDNYLLHLKKF
jgi:predicted ATPase